MVIRATKTSHCEEISGRTGFRVLNFTRDLGAIVAVANKQSARFTVDRLPSTVTGIEAFTLPWLNRSDSRSWFRCAPATSQYLGRYNRLIVSGW
ncbi:hypothetical protein ANTRET_LOCUS7974 [Anthophora retusa]